MMAGNPSWWSMHSELRSSAAAASDHQAVTPNLLFPQTHPSNSSLFPIHEHLHAPSSSSNSSSSSLAHQHHHAQDFPHSWSQLLLGGLGTEEERYGASVLESTRVVSKDVKQEESRQSNKGNNFYGYHNIEEEEDVEEEEGSWSQAMAVSSPRSCVTTLSSNTNILDFSANNKSSLQLHHQPPHHSNSQNNSTSTGELPKKPKLQSSSTPPLKVRKEKLGDRITTLHQLVSPFGKTDTASVLLEAIGYIRFLQTQIQALSSPYLGSNDNASTKNQHSVHGERNNCLFPDHPGQLLNDSFIKRRAAANNEEEDKRDAARNLSSKGLCLVPISCTHLVGSDSGADYWAQSLGGGF